jgi:hypothetical protein
MSWLRDMFVGNWRNKGVALFFSITIWYVAYQSERQSHSAFVRVDLLPAESGQGRIITSAQGIDPRTGEHAEFDGRVKMSFSGPRKQIIKLREEALGPYQLQLPKEKEVHELRQEDFGFPRDGVEIVQFVPESLRVVQEDSATVTVQNLADKVQVSRGGSLREGFEIAAKEVTPASLLLTGPKSLLGSIGVSLNVNLDFDRDRFDGRVDVTLTHPPEIAPELVRRTVRAKPSEVRVSVALRDSTDVFPVEAVRISFRLPPVRIPVKILIDDLVGDTIPLEFFGRKEEIARLRERLREQPGFAVGVRVPTFDREQGGQFTFTEDSLELYGFPGVQIRQHESRRKEKKTAWSYTVVPVKEPEK